MKTEKYYRVCWNLKHFSSKEKTVFLHYFNTFLGPLIFNFDKKLSVLSYTECSTSKIRTI